MAATDREQRERVLRETELRLLLREAGEWQRRRDAAVTDGYADEPNRYEAIVRGGQGRDDASVFADAWVAVAVFALVMGLLIGVAVGALMVSGL